MLGPTGRRNERVRVLLAEHWPHLFTEPVPLAIGIDKDIEKAIGDLVTRRRLENFMFGWTRRPAYRRAVKRGDARQGLDEHHEGVAPLAAALPPLTTIVMEHDDG
jgi:sRNA-binding protein